MSGPRAAGVHLPFPAVPDRVAAWVEDRLGSRVVQTLEQVGGMSPGCVTRIVGADGTRAFVKAVGTELNPDSPALHRREALALGLLGSHPLWADLLATYDDGEWVALLLEDVEGSHPDPTDDTVMARLLDQTDELGRVMNRRVPSPPRPVEGAAGPPLFRPGLTDLRSVFRGWLDGLDRAGDLPVGLVPSWLVDGVADLRPGLLALAELPMDHLVHWDIRNDNLLVRASGDIVFLDWGACGVGPDWLDPLLARLERVHLSWFDESLATSPALARAGDDVVTSWLVGIGAFLAYRAHTAVDVNLPTLAAFRRQESRRFLDAAARRLGV